MHSPGSHESAVSLVLLSLLLVAGCGEADSAKDGAIDSLTTKVAGLEESLRDSETRCSQMEQEVEKVKDVQRELILPSVEPATKADIASIEKRLAALEHEDAKLVTRVTRIEFMRANQAAPSTPSPPTTAASPPVRTKEYLLTELDKGLRKAMVAGLAEETKDRVRAQYGYFKEQVEAGTDPRLSLQEITDVGAEDVLVTREFFPEFLPD
ncbi:MAG: hypothetical protein RIC55_15455 [Pirellulaceae bacterium]